MAFRIAMLAASIIATTAAENSGPFLEALKKLDIEPSEHLISDLLRYKKAQTAAKLKEAIASNQAVNHTVTTKYGSLTGLDLGNVTMYLGVPFAQPPVGPLRWVNPLEVAPWGSLDAQWPRDICQQNDYLPWGLGTGMSEDCLYMDIYVPSTPPPPGGFPVMLFWYGGSWDSGSASFLIYDGEFDVSLVKDVIMVASNYRLDVFGFLAGDLLKNEAADGSSGNYGLMDQTQSLKFMVATASAFGGNPNLITIFGESAGAGSVTDHLVSPQSAGLFQRAIMESGAFTPWSAQPYNISKTRLPQVLAESPCRASPTPLACLRGLNATAVLAASKHLTKGFLEWSPTIDGVIIPDDPRALLAAGKAAKVPVLFGSNLDEGTLFVNADHSINASGYAQYLAPFLGPAAQATVAEYPPSDYPAAMGASDVWWAISKVMGDCTMTCPAREAARGFISTGTSSSVYVYYFTHNWWIVKYLVDLFRPLGVCHAVELLATFDVQIGAWGEGEAALMKQWVRYWTRFAAAGDPNGDGDPAWPAFGSGAGDTVAIIDTSAAGPNVTVVHDLRKDQCDFWLKTPIAPCAVWGGPCF